jgi:hypothetical protein
MGIPFSQGGTTEIQKENVSTPGKLTLPSATIDMQCPGYGTFNLEDPIALLILLLLLSSHQ